MKISVSKQISINLLKIDIMEAKKNPKANLEKSRSIFFLIGMLISMVLVLAAFNYATETDIVGILNDRME